MKECINHPGRWASAARGMCKACYHQAQKHGDVGNFKRPEQLALPFKFPSAPLKEVVKRAAVVQGQDYFAFMEQRGFGRDVFRHDMVTYLTADKVCIAIGIHPVQVYGTEWWKEAA